MTLAKENDFYRQQYCGCKYSIRKENIRKLLDKQYRMMYISVE